MLTAASGPSASVTAAGAGDASADAPPTPAPPLDAHDDSQGKHSDSNTQVLAFGHIIHNYHTTSRYYNDITNLSTSHDWAQTTS